MAVILMVINNSGLGTDFVPVLKSNIDYKSIDELSDIELERKIRYCESDLDRFLNTVVYPPAYARSVKCKSCVKHCNEELWKGCGIDLDVYCDPINNKLGEFIVPEFRRVCGLLCDELIVNIVDGDISTLISDHYLVVLDYLRRIYSQIDYHYAVDLVNDVNQGGSLRLITFLQDHIDSFGSFLKKSLYIKYVADADRKFDQKLSYITEDLDSSRFTDGYKCVKSHKPYLGYENDIKGVEPLFSTED
jgi:hypothetical protein